MDARSELESTHSAQLGSLNKQHKSFNMFAYNH